MLGSITPLGERGRRSRWGITTAMHVAGSLLGGAAVGALAGVLGSLALAGVSIHARVAALAAALTAGLAWELYRGAIPGPRRQVDERWLDRYRGWVYGLGYGTQLGAGLATVIVASAVYVVPVAAFLTARPLAGTVVGGVAGVLRGASVLAAARVTSPAELLAFHVRMRVAERPVRAVALGVQLALAGAAALVVAG
jgi:hypothetical protein